MSKETVPITPAVLKWAIKESGRSEEEIASKLDITLQLLKSWQSEEPQLGLTEFKKLAKLFKLQPAIFLLPESPDMKMPEISFRHPPGPYRDSLVADELIYIRKTVRLQKVLSWVCKEIDEEPITQEITVNPTAETPDSAANKVRAALNLTEEGRRSWRNYSTALKSIRGKLEDKGISVFFLPLGEEQVNGFSIWDRYAPAIAINTHWNEGSRVFTLFHELAHLLTRTNSACLQAGPRLNRRSDSLERWCERFSASVLMPISDIREFLSQKLKWPDNEKINDLDIVRRIASHFKVSLTAATLRLIDNDLADWDLFHEIPMSSDKKGGGFGRSVEGRTRAVIFEQQYGFRSEKLFVDAVKRNVIAYSDALNYADVPHVAFDSWQRKYA